MDSATTEQRLARMTDEGEFEKLATAVLRVADPLCAALTHTGVTAERKTRKAPLDGIGFVRHAEPPHIVLVHHTLTAAKGLRSKWLNDPAKVKPRKPGGTPTAPLGDVLKTAEIVVDERLRSPDLRATLLLTSNEEPDQDLIRDVRAAGAMQKIDVEVWSRSRLAHVLDVCPDGQWLRFQAFGVPAERLSPELMSELSRRSQAAGAPLDDQRAWTPRALDRTLGALRRPVTFLVAGSGLGKSVSCYRTLEDHLSAGGHGLILGHDDILTAVSLDHAVAEALRRMHPALGPGESALSLCRPDRPLLVIVEDINRSGQAERLAEKIAGWGGLGNVNNTASAQPWRLICPVWPQTVSRFGETLRKAIEPAMLVPAPMSPDEGAAAVIARAEVAGRTLSRFAAAEVSAALGHDPLLIAIRDSLAARDAQTLIAGYVGRSLERMEADGDGDAITTRDALLSLGSEMLARRRLDPTWAELQTWPKAAAVMTTLRAIARRQEILGLESTSPDPTVQFRHDRVRDRLLVDAAANLYAASGLSEDIVADPFYAEILGALVMRAEAFAPLLKSLASQNPLALFHALRLCPPDVARRSQIVSAIQAWLIRPENQGRATSHLRWAAEITLSDTDGIEVLRLVNLLPHAGVAAWMARLRNGDVGGGVMLCGDGRLGTTWSERDNRIADAKVRYGEGFLAAIDGLLRRPELPRQHLCGALGLAGYVGEPAIGPAILAAWNREPERLELLDDFLWAFSRCCDATTAAAYLEPVCSAWAALSNTEKKTGMGSDRDSLAAHGVRIAFGRHPPSGALPYFIARAEQPDLAWPITYMLHEVDHPLALVFLAERIAGYSDASNGWSVFQHSVTDHWRRRQEAGSAMSAPSRERLMTLWMDPSNRPTLRRAAFAIWSEIEEDGDLTLLRQVSGDETLASMALRERLKRADVTAMPLLFERLHDAEMGWRWWHSVPQTWRPKLLAPLEDALTRRAAQPPKEDSNSDWALAEALVRLPVDEAERLLVKHWEQLKGDPKFFQLALYTATPALQALAAEVVASAAEPRALFHLISAVYAVRQVGHPGVTRERQILALEPFLDLLETSDIRSLAEACNEGGWFDTRRRLLDPRLDDRRVGWRPEHTPKMCEELARHGRDWIDLEIKMALACGLSWPELCDQIEGWFVSRGDIPALSVFASALRHSGTRGDLAKLRVCGGMDVALAEAIIEDTAFVVKRRSAR